MLVVHGGLFSRPGVTLDELRRLDRDREPPHGAGDLMMEALWSDPRAHAGVAPSQRGGNTISFGPDVTRRFLAANGLELVVRSHASDNKVSECSPVGLVR